MIGLAPPNGTCPSSDRQVPTATSTPLRRPSPRCFLKFSMVGVVSPSPLALLMSRSPGPRSGRSPSSPGETSMARSINSWTASRSLPGLYLFGRGRRPDGIGGGRPQRRPPWVDGRRVARHDAAVAVRTRRFGHAAAIEVHARSWQAAYASPLREDTSTTWSQPRRSGMGSVSLNSGPVPPQRRHRGSRRWRRSVHRVWLEPVIDDHDRASVGEGGDLSSLLRRAGRVYWTPESMRAALERLEALDEFPAPSGFLPRRLIGSGVDQVGGGA